jgi:mono/diheme cytochrome c family protein
MKETNMVVSARKPVFARMTARLHASWVGAVLASVVLLAGCAIEFQNTQAAQQVAQQSKPPGSVYVGWRVFQERCAVCHGSAAAGGAGGPDLLPRVRDMGSRQFVSLVLNRYDWGLPTAKAGTDSATREALIDDVVQGRQGAMTMPAWQGEPVVSAHIADLYAYLSARAQGTQGPGRPAP